MKKFIKYSIGGIVAIMVLMTLLDLAYTKIYENSYPRTKFQYLRSLKDKKVDYIFLGSSRVENGIVPSIIHNKTGKEAVNLGGQAAKLDDIYTVLQLINEYNIHCKTIFIQIDYSYNSVEGNSNIFQYEMAPFLRENEITKHYSDKYAASPLADYYLPFYRYCTNDLKLGFREVWSNLIGQKTTIVLNKGFTALLGNPKELKGSLPDRIINRNVVLDNIRAFCKQNKIEVVYFCAPFCKYNRNQGYITKLKNKIPELIDFSGAIQNDQMFVNCNHLNEAGAKRFTEIIVDKLLAK
jgi:hypothetical protein